MLIQYSQQKRAWRAGDAGDRVLNLKELVVLFLVYGLLAKLLGKWSQAASTLALVFLTTLSAMYFVVTVKTRVVYGAYYLLDEFVHFVVLYGPTYLTPLACASALGVLLGLALVPYGLVVLGRRREWARGTMVILAFVSLLWGTAGWLLPPEDVPEYISRGPLGLLVGATIRDAEYRERGIGFGETLGSRGIAQGVFGFWR